MTKVPITIIGGGVIGCAIAYELSKNLDQGIFLIEKNKKITGENQSSRNSGVIHAGIYYPKKEEPLKAQLCVKGNELLYDFCEKHDIPYRKTGKIIVMTNPREEEYLDHILMTALQNNVEARKITEKEVREMEPNVRASSALYFPSSGIVEPTELVKKLELLAAEQGANFITGNEVIDIKPENNSFSITTRTNKDTEVFDTDILINAAGLYSDEIAKMVNPNSPYEMEPVRGESAKFCKLNRSDINMNGMNVYPVPHGFYKETGEKAEVSFKQFQSMLKKGIIGKTVGVHLTPTFDLIEGSYVLGNIATIGPIYTAGTGKEDLSSGLKQGIDYLERIISFFPNLTVNDISLHQAGIQARCQRDFVIEKDERYNNCINLIGIGSPGLTSCLAIAEYVKKLMSKN